MSAMNGIEVVAAHDGKEPSVYLWIKPGHLIPNGRDKQFGPLSANDVRALALELLDAIESAEGLGS
jgi:hypothetical protein